MNNLIEFNENLDTPIFRPSILEDLQQKHLYFEVPSFDSQINRQDNPHHWVQQDILQITHFQYNFIQNLTLKKGHYTTNSNLCKISSKVLSIQLSTNMGTTRSICIY